MDALQACRAARRAWELSQPQTFLDFEDSGLGAFRDVSGDTGAQALVGRAARPDNYPAPADLATSTQSEAFRHGNDRTAGAGTSLAGSPEHHPCHDASTVPRGGSHDALPASPINNTSHGARARQGIALHGSGGEV